LQGRPLRRMPGQKDRMKLTFCIYFVLILNTNVLLRQRQAVVEMLFYPILTLIRYMNHRLLVTPMYIAFIYVLCRNKKTMFIK
jgi:hypothetical protein